MHLLPALRETDAREAAVVVIDVLRASTTILAALHHGAAAVVPCASIEQARRLAAELQPPGVLGGERQGVRIEGFDLGNSPLEYTPQAIGGRTVVLATTNGTRAVASCHGAGRIVIGALANASAVVRRLRGEPSVGLVCSGTDERVTGEDAIFAGRVVDRLLEESPDWTLNDQAWLARAAWRAIEPVAHDPARLAAVLAQMHGGRNLARRQMTADIEFCAVLDRYAIVPWFDPQRQAIVATADPAAGGGADPARRDGAALSP